MIGDAVSRLGHHFTEKAIFCAKTKMLHKGISGDFNNYLNCSILEFIAKII